MLFDKALLNFAEGLRGDGFKIKVRVTCMDTCVQIAKVRKDSLRDTFYKQHLVADNPYKHLLRILNARQGRDAGIFFHAILLLAGIF